MSGLGKLDVLSATNSKIEFIIEKLIAKEVLDAYKATVEFLDVKGGGMMLELW